MTKWTLVYKPSGVFTLAEGPLSETSGVSGGSVTVRKSTRTARRRAPTEKKTARSRSCRRPRCRSLELQTTPPATFAVSLELQVNDVRKKSR